MARRIEWIGVKSPLQDDRITYRMIMGAYTDDEEVMLEAVANLVAPLVRQYGSTARGKGTREGLSKDYVWGPKRYIIEMPDIDADRLFSHPDEYEWRDLDEPKHDNRVPIVPWPYITKMLWRVMEEARNGPGVVLKGQKIARSDREVAKLLESWASDHVDKAHERGLKLDPETLRVVR